MTELPSEREILGTIESATHLLASHLADVERRMHPLIRDLEVHLAQDLQALSARKAKRLSTLELEYDGTRQNALKEIQQVLNDLGPAAAVWTDPCWRDSDYTPPNRPPGALRFGTLRFVGKRSGTVEGPALLPFNRHIVIQASGPAREEAIRLVQALTLRRLLLLPPGKLRLVMMDPLGLGESLAAFVALRTHLPELITEKIWVEPSDLEKQLASMTAHMERVVQTYLGGRYASIDEYNQTKHAIEEPYRLLVIQDFPAGFSEEAARRLMRIVAAGSRCGVHCLVTIDKTQPVPRSLDLTEVERLAAVIVLADDGVAWSELDLQGANLSLDRPPHIDDFERLVQLVGDCASRAASERRPFENLMDPPSEWWRGDTTAGLYAPIGFAMRGETQQFAVGGEGGAQHAHALLAGRTGFGKSNLLHVLVTSLALRYPPEELEMYLIDFKKGVEFKVYAESRLPHARAIAIESEREFGLSVLQELDAELAKRGNRFRAAACNDLQAYRRANRVCLPRVLLVVDEFQEFFREDDQLAREAALILDRLARQGRGYGIHLVLSSQTLAGSHSLPRSTMDQMAVRIAFQCSDADARLILADDNPAARDLSRPGEACYNEKGGLKEGNRWLQVAWLEPDKIGSLIKDLSSMARARDLPRRAIVVFEGNAPAEMVTWEDHPIHSLLTASDWPNPDSVIKAWLGNPVAIAQPTKAAFSLAAGRNMVVVGRDETSAAGLVCATFVSVAAQCPPGAVEFHVTAHASSIGQDSLTVIGSSFPHVMSFVPTQDLDKVVVDLAGSVERRLRHEAPTDPRIFLMLLGLHHCRALRRTDDFVAAMPLRGNEPQPADRLAFVLREGPEVGVHVVVWSDSVATLRSVVDRRAMECLGVRVATTLSERESHELMDDVAAARLGPNRALLVDDENVGKKEKFRPFGPPRADWLRRVGDQLKRRHATYHT